MQCLGDGDVSTVYRRAILTIVTVLVNPTADDLLRLMVILYKGALAGFYHPPRVLVCHSSAIRGAECFAWHVEFLVSLAHWLDPSRMTWAASLPCLDSDDVYEEEDQYALSAGLRVFA